jgi:hypothetical protein
MLFKNILERLGFTWNKSVAGDVKTIKMKSKQNVQPNAPAIIARGSVQAGSDIIVGNQTIHNYDPKQKSEPKLYPYIFISEKQNTSDRPMPFIIKVNNQDAKPWFFEAFEIDGNEYKIGRSLQPQQETRNISVEGMPPPDISGWYNKRYDKCFLIVSGDDSSTRKIEIKINMEASADGERFKFQWNSFEARPISTEIINQPSEG